jgi:hypothetical protein
MAAISGITDGEILSSVRTKLNNVITEINLLDPTDWIDYSSTSTVVGWSSLPTKIIKYRIIGKQVFVIFSLDGTSNNTATTFTLPNNALTGNELAGRFVNNGALTAGYTRISSASNVITFLSLISSATWTASGNKVVSGQFFYDIA